MTSIGSLPFTIEAKGAETRALFHIKNRSRPRFYRPRKSLNFAASRGFGTSRTAEDECIRVLSSGITSVRAARGDSVDGGDIDGESTEDALEATIEKSRKVLAMQRELLNQAVFSTFFSK